MGTTHNSRELSEPLVSIICDVYNHEAYLKDCLNGLVCQKTSFRYVILIHDDASTDSSPQIIKEYYEKYPELFKPIFQKDNQYSKGIGIWKSFQFPRVKTKYIAFCEGDDYWIDQDKLQKQVNYLENHIECSGVFGNIIVRNENKDFVIEDQSSMKSRYYTQIDVLKGILFPLASICIKQDVINNWDYNIKANGDIVLAYIATKIGYVFMLDDYMSVYRKTGKGVCTSKNSEDSLVAEISEWYNFHKQIGFPHPSTLIFHQSQSLFRYFLKNSISEIPYKKIIKDLRIKYLFLYIYYFIYFLTKHLIAICHTK